MNVGVYIKKLRLDAGYSQEELGQLLGVQRAAVQKWESGKVQNLKRETIYRLAELFSVPTSSFFADDESANGSNKSRGVLTANEAALLHAYRSDTGLRTTVNWLLNAIPQERERYITMLADEIRTELPKKETDK